MIQLSLCRFLVSSGFGSRRKITDLIKNQQVLVNDSVVTAYNFLLQDQDIIQIADKKITYSEKKIHTKVILFNKPRKYICSTKDEIHNRNTVYSLLPEKYKNFIMIGRLDFNTEGLLLFTNNGQLSRYLELPHNNITRKYLIKVFGAINLTKLKAISQGVTIDNIKYKNFQFEILKNPNDKLLNSQDNSSNNWLSIILQEGKNNEIRILMKHIGLQVNRLIRVEYGDFSLSSIEKGHIYKISHDKLHKFINKEFLYL